MIKKQKQSFLNNYIGENKIRLIINLSMLLAGVICGSLLFLCSANSAHFSEEVKTYIESIGSLDRNRIFISSLKDAGIICLVFFICSLVYIGEFLCPFYVFFRSSASGFCACAVMGAFGIGKGMLFLASLVPANVFYFTGAVVFSVETAKQSRFMGGGFDKKSKRRSFISYLLTVILPELFIFIGCVVESFCVPYLILWCLKNF